MTYKGFGGYRCDVCGEGWQEATYFLFIEYKGKKYHVCDPIEQSKWLTETPLCLMSLAKKIKLGECKIERIFGNGD